MDADTSKIKTELEDEDLLFNGKEDPPKTGLEMLGEELEEEERRQQELHVEMSEGVSTMENPRLSQKKKKSLQETEYLRKKKAVLKTFGMSSRPRRSVNYASIERGDEATAQSLVTALTTTSKKRTKRSRDDLDENFELVEVKPKRTRQPKPAQNKEEEKKGKIPNLNDFYRIIPAWNGERPNFEDRVFASKLENTYTIRRSSGGFKRFISWMKDATICKLYSYIEENYVTTAIEDDAKMMQSIRQAWNMLPDKLRKKWERAARMDAFESYKFIGSGTLPLSEVAIETREDKKRKKPTGGIKANCCEANVVFSKIMDVIKHFISSHDSVHLFGCQFCRSIFPSKSSFRNHACSGFNNYLMKLTIGNELMEMKGAFMFVSCIDCGLWLPLRMSTENEKFWPFFSTMMMAHSCKTLVPVIIFFTEQLTDQEIVQKMNFSVFPRQDCAIEISCEECSIESFSSITEIDDHFKTVHPERQKKCPRCDVVCGTDFIFRFHIVRHFNDSLLFANYLRYTATYHPPEMSRRYLHYGNLKENVMIGGIFNEKLEGSGFEEMVDPDEDTTKQKLLNCLLNVKLRAKSRTPCSNDSDDSAFSEAVKEYRADMGYEHIKYEDLLGENELQKEAKEKLISFMGETGKQLLEFEDVVIDERKVLEMIETANKNPKFEIDTSENGIAEEMSRLYVRSISLPLAACVDPLKDFLLLNRIFYFCDKCVHVFCSDTEEHAKECDVEVDTISVLYAPNMPISDGIRCPDVNCDMKVCSVISLRCHVALAHGRFLSFEMQKPGRYDQSISVLTRHQQVLRLDKRSNIARFTDADMGMPVSGQLEKKNRAALVPKQAGNASSSKTVATYPVVVSKIMKPYKDNKFNIKSFDCTWCPFNSVDINQFKTHLIKTHVHCCEICGRVFSIIEKRRNHGCSRVFWKDQHRVSSMVMGTCKQCGVRMPIHALYSHIIKMHFSEVRYNMATGEFVALAQDVRCEAGQSSTSPTAPVRAHERIRYVRFDLDPIERAFLTIGMHPVSKPPDAVVWVPPSRNTINQRLSCYLCEMPHSTEQELDAHLARHPEVFKFCPFCMVEVDGHYKMQMHLLIEHTKRSGSTMNCSFCGDNITNSPCTHHIYKCTRTLNCGMCGLAFRSNEDKVKHMANVHATDLRRFQCSYCAHVFIAMQQFYSHSCSTQALYLCDCDDKKLFKSVPDFCDHYDSLHIKARYHCELCNTQHKSVSTIASHRQMHMNTISPASIRNVYVLVKWAFAARQPVKRVVAHRRPQGLTMQERLQAIFDKPTGSRSPTPGKPEVVTVDDDDDDDDDDIVFEGTVSRGVLSGPSSSKSKSASREISPAGFENEDPPPLEAMNVVNAEVRVEATEGLESAGGQGQPGYVEDDVECISEIQVQPDNATEMPQKTSKVKLVVDDKGDDELTVVAEVENVSGVLSSVIAATSREKKFKCPKCSCAYLTNSSLIKHLESHKSDAGASTSMATYGLPKECTAWVCRNCCLAFESHTKYEEHASVHGDTQLSCRWCSGIAFNGSIITQHNRGHDNNTVFYACGTCKMRFFSDLHLMDHLSITHKVMMFFFCKLCGYGSTWLDNVYTHCSKNHVSDYTILQRIGACPQRLLNYEPIDEEDFKRKIAHGVVSCVTPSDCTHRSLLLASDCLVSCIECHCTQSLHSYVAYNSIDCTEARPMNFKMSEPVDTKHRLYPLMGYAGRGLKDSMLRFGQQVPRMNVMANNTVNVLNHSSHIIRFPAREDRNLNGTRVIVPVNHNTQPYQQLHAVPRYSRVPRIDKRVIVSRPTNSPFPTRYITNRVITNRMTPTRTTPENMPVSEVLTQLANSLTTNGITSSRCETCRATLSTEYDKKKHEMHRLIDHGFMCGNCSKPEKTEMDLIIHYYNAHLAPVIKSKGSDSFRPLVYNLECPHPQCKGVAYKSLKPFERHLQSHTDILPFESKFCGTRFGSENKMVYHDQTHQEYEQNGCDASCCPLCGVLDMWTLPREQYSTSFVLSHMAVHGLSYFSVCRVCFHRHSEDHSLSHQLNHFANKHLNSRMSKYTCICGVSDLSLQDAYQHIREKHTFIMLRQSESSKYGELVVKAGGQLQNYLGMRRRFVRETLSPAYPARRGIEAMDAESTKNPPVYF